MMPRRWIELDSEATEVERSLLALSPDPDPGPGAQERVWQALLARLPGPTDPEGNASSTPQGSTGQPGTPDAGSLGGSLERGVSLGTLAANHGLGFVVGVATTTLAFLLIDPFHRSESPPPREPAPQAAATAPRAVAADATGVPSTHIEELELERPDRGPPPLRANPTPAESALAPRTQVSAASQLSEEAALLREARSRLAHGDLQGASEVLAASKARFPNSRLAQEREAATIELLRRSGDSASAAARARAFLSKYPNSPHARQVERALPATTE